MRIIDFRLRPPSHGFLKLRLFSEAQIRGYAEQLRVLPPPASLNRSMDQFWAEVEEVGITLGVIHGRQCREPIGTVSNEDIADLQGLYPDRLIGLGSVPLGRPDTLAQVDRAVQDLGLHGISLDPGFCDPPLYASADEVYQVARRCGALRVPLLLTMSVKGGPDLSYADPVHVDRLAAACPETAIVVGHGCWPYAQEMCGVAFARRNVYVSPDMYMMRCPGVSDFVSAINSFLADRFLFASAYPSCPLKPLVDYFAELPIDDRLRPRIMYDNAARLLGIG